MRSRFLPLLVILAGLALRLHGIGNPFLDSHAERQAQVAMVARNFYENGMDVRCPRLDIFGPGRGCAVFEFPLVHAMAALLYFPFGEQEAIGRLVSIVFSVGAMIVLYALAREFLPPAGAIGALALYALSPLNVYFSRAFMSESSLLFFSLAAVYTGVGWLRAPTTARFTLAIAAAALAFLAKPTAVVVLAPVLAAWFERERRRMLLRPALWAYVVLALTPALAWGAYANVVNLRNADIPASWQWLPILTERGGLFRWWISADFYVAMGQSLGGLIFTPLGVVLIVLGAFSIDERAARYVLFAWLIALIAYMFILAGANHGHVYYQLPFLPPGALVAGFGVNRIVQSGLFGRLWTTGWMRIASTVAAVSIIAAHVAGYYVFFRYMYDTSLRMPYVREVARIIRERTPTDAVLILNQPNASTTVLTYYAQRPSWDFGNPLDADGVRQLERLRRRGGTAYVAIETRYGNGVVQTRDNASLWRYLNDRYAPIALSSHYLIFDVTTPRR